jgi:2-amino-4-hydroxy-6-hydroxymethyldihydropteridine diphosphokinase
MNPASTQRAEPLGSLARETLVHLGMGSNVGDRLAHLRRALFALATHPEIRVDRISRVYETEYVGPGKQDPFSNACLAIRTTLPPQVLLAVLKGTEARLGRGPDGHMLPRPIDLDILLYGNELIDEERLTVPHPQIRDRAFVLVPLTEIAGREKFPDSGETITEACAKIRRKSGPWIKVGDEVRLVEVVPDGNKEDWRAALAVHCR